MRCSSALASSWYAWTSPVAEGEGGVPECAAKPNAGKATIYQLMEEKVLVAMVTKDINPLVSGWTRFN